MYKIIGAKMIKDKNLNMSMQNGWWTLITSCHEKVIDM